MPNIDIIAYYHLYKKVGMDFIKRCMGLIQVHVVLQNLFSVQNRLWASKQYLHGLNAKFIMIRIFLLMLVRPFYRMLLPLKEIKTMNMMWLIWFANTFQIWAEVLMLEYKKLGKIEIVNFLTKKLNVFFS